MTRLLALLLLLPALLAAAPASAADFDPFDLAGIEERPGAAVPLDLPLVDDRGREVTLRELGGGRPILLAPVLHDCPNICGVTLAGVAQAVAAQDYRPGEDFVLVAFGIDPAETPEQAAEALAELRATFPLLAGEGVHAVVGGEETVTRVTRTLGYRYAWDERIGQYAHVAATAVLMPDGRLARWLYGLTPDPFDLKLALTEAGEGRLGDWGDQLLLLCYRYDPETGQYGATVWGALRIAGGLFVLGGVGWIGRALLRETRRKGGR